MWLHRRGAPRVHGALGDARRAGQAPVCSRVRWAPPALRQGPVARVQTGEAAPGIAQLTQSVVDAEAKLSAMFEPGKPMPRAGVVAELRQEIVVMKERLAAAMGGAGGGAGSASGSGIDKDMEAHARQAFLEVERVIGEQTSRNRPDDGAAIAVLEAENERLRAEATALLLHQQQLEELTGRLRQERQERRRKGEFNASAATEAAAEMVAASMMEDVQQAARRRDGSSLGIGTSSRF